MAKANPKPMTTTDVITKNLFFEPEVRSTFIVDQGKVNMIKDYAHQSRRTIKSVMDQVLSEFIARHIEKNFYVMVGKSYLSDYEPHDDGSYNLILSPVFEKALLFEDMESAQIHADWLDGQVLPVDGEVK